jgi:hypothetical protein
MSFISSVELTVALNLVLCCLECHSVEIDDLLGNSFLTNSEPESSDSVLDPRNSE